MGILILVLLLLGFISFILAAGQATVPRANLIGVGLAFWILTELLARLHTAATTP